MHLNYWHGSNPAISLFAAPLITEWEEQQHVLYAELDQPVLPHKMFGVFLVSFQNQNVGSRVLGQLFECGFEDTLETIILLCFYAR